MLRVLCTASRSQPVFQLCVRSAGSSTFSAAALSLQGSTRRSLTTPPLLNLIETRHCTHAFDPDKPVPRETVASILRAARNAPSTNNSQASARTVHHCNAWSNGNDDALKRCLAHALAARFPSCLSVGFFPPPATYTHPLQPWLSRTPCALSCSHTTLSRTRACALSSAVTLSRACTCIPSLRLPAMDRACGTRGHARRARGRDAG